MLDFLSGLGNIFSDAVKDIINVILGPLARFLIIFAGQPIIRSVMPTDLMNTMGKWLNITDGGSPLNTAWVVGGGIYQALAVVGAGLMLIYWFMDFADKSIQNRLSFETMLMSLAEFVIALVIITNGWTIVQGIVDITSQLYIFIGGGFAYDTNYDGPLGVLYNTIMGTTFSSDDLSVKMGAGVFGVDPNSVSSWNDIATNAIATHGAINCFARLISLVLTGLMAGLTGWIVDIGFMAIVISRSFQLCIYGAFAPIAMADIFHRGFLDSQGFAYIKKMLALGLQGLVLLIIALIGQSAIMGALSSSVDELSNVALQELSAPDQIIGTGIGAFLRTLILPFAIRFVQLGVGFKSLTICNDILGAK